MALGCTIRNNANGINQTCIKSSNSKYKSSLSPLASSSSSSPSPLKLYDSESKSKSLIAVCTFSKKDQYNVNGIGTGKSMC